MTFIDMKTSREAQKARQKKDGRGRRQKFDTPDRPGTALAYSLTGKGERKSETALQAAMREAQERDSSQRTNAAASAMARMAKAARKS
jgi:regulator of protease activity HflC (stomatin/prohibitin superfamily)